MKPLTNEILKLVAVTHLSLIVRRHPLDGLAVHVDGSLVLSVVGVKSAQVEQSRDLGGLVRARIFESRTVQLRASPVDVDRFIFVSEQGQDQPHVQVGH